MAYGNLTAPAAGAALPVDVISGANFPRTKISFGAEGSSTDVSSAAPLPVTLPGSVAVTGTFYQVTQPVSLAGTVTVTGPLTDAQIRATALPISGNVGVTGSVAVTGTFYQATQPVSIAGTVTVSGGLTDTQLRATAVPVSGTVGVTGTFWQATQPVSGTVGISGTVPVSGTFWQATQPISVASLPLPSGAATEATMSAQSAKLPASLGTKAPSASLSVTPAGLEYEVVPASSAAQPLGATGAVGDYLSHLVIQPATTTPGAVTVHDGANTIMTLPSGTLVDLTPIIVPMNATSTQVGGWKITTGTNISVVGFGDFT